jgi:hypothetical protein
MFFRYLTLLSFLSSSLMTSCVPSFNERGVRRGGSTLSSVNFKVPAVESLVASDGSKPVDGLRLQVRPVDASCLEATKIDQTIAVSSLSAIQEKVRKGCAYDVTVELGKIDDPARPTSLTDVFYAQREPSRVTADMTQQERIPLSLTLMLTDTGRSKGLPERPVTGDGSDFEPEPRPDPSPSPTPDLRPQPQPQPQPQRPGPSSLPARLNVSLTGTAGPVPLSEIFTKEYMVVDFSRPGCGPCVSLSRSLESDRRFKAFFAETSKCSYLTVTPPNQLSDWKDIVGANSWSAKQSYAYVGSHSGFGNLFGFSVTGTPTFMVVDRTGRVVKNSSGGLPNGLSSLCQ